MRTMVIGLSGVAVIAAAAVAVGASSPSKSAKTAKTAKAASAPARAAHAALPGEDWKVSGWETTTCCCNDICPCRYNEKPTHMECESTISVHIDRGHYGATKLDGVNFILLGRGFDFTGSKGWNKVYVDQKATPEQQKAVGGVLAGIVSSYKPEVAQRVFGAEGRGMQTVAMTFTKSSDGMLREVDAPGVCHVKARLGRIPGSTQPVHIVGVFTEFAPTFYPAAAGEAEVDPAAAAFDHPQHHRAEVEDFTITREDYASHRLGFQNYNGQGGCLMPRK